MCEHAHWDNVVTFAGEVQFKRQPPTSIEPEGTLGERIDCRKSQPKVPHTEDDKAEQTFLIFQVDKASLKVSKESRRWLPIRSDGDTTRRRLSGVLICGSEIHAEQNGNLERHEVSWPRC